MGVSFRRKSLIASSIAAMATLAIAGGSGPTPLNKSLGGAPLRAVDVSIDSAQLLASDLAGRGLFAIDALSGESRRLSTNATASYGATLSPDGQLAAYKSIDKHTGVQSPVVFHIASGQEYVLSTAALAGTPAFSSAGKIAFTVGNQLYILNIADLSSVSFDLHHHVNLVALSADATKAAYNTEDDQIVVIDITTGARTTVTDGNGTYYHPQFSPDGRHLLLRTINGEVAVTSSAGVSVKVIGIGESPAWLDNDSVAYTVKDTVEGVEVLETALLGVNISGQVEGVLASTAGDATAIARDGALAFAPTGQNTPDGIKPARAVDDGLAPTSSDLQVGLAADGIAYTQPLSVQLEEIPFDRVDVRDATEPINTSAVSRDVAGRAVVDAGTYVYLNNTTFIHQNNDSPDWWNGNWSCNAACALMVLQYYNTLPKHPMNVSWPTPHVSDYGWYIPNTYTFSGHTYNVPSKDPNGTTGYGGYGYITQKNWEETRGHMRDYFIKHGATSAVDWSPTYAKAKTEINNNKPFVLLNSLTSAGHYIVCIGYMKNQHTLIFDDPYGNKNTGYYPSNNGRQVRYDWPGYNNGYSNLNTVHAYIWGRKNQATTIVVDNTSSGFTASSNWSTGTSATDKYGSNYRFRATQAISDQATWNFNITKAGNYSIQTWYSQGSNRAPAAPFTMPDGTKVNKNQQTGGGSWQTLATKHLAVGNRQVHLSCWTTTGYVVMADAVRVVPQF